MYRVMVLILILMLAFPLSAFAEFTIKMGNRNLLELTEEAKIRVPELEGMHENLLDGTVTFQRRSGDFTSSERVLLRQVVTVHDPNIAAKRHQALINSRVEKAQRIRQKLGLSAVEWKDLKDALRE